MKNELYPAVNAHHFVVDGRRFFIDGDTGYFCEEIDSAESTKKRNMAFFYWARLCIIV